jgi:phosphoglycolate phosphatase
LDVSPEEALFVGDGEADLDVAKNAGIKSVWVSWGFRKIEELEGRIPDFQINLPSDLLKLL